MEAFTAGKALGQALNTKQELLNTQSKTDYQDWIDYNRLEKGLYSSTQLHIYREL